MKWRLSRKKGQATSDPVRLFFLGWQTSRLKVV